MLVSYIFVALVSLSGILASYIPIRRQQRAFPTCAIQCLGVAERGSCSLTDNACLCKSKTYVDGTTACISQKCPDPQDVQTAYGFSVALCKAAGVDLLAQKDSESTVESSTTPPAPSATESSASAATDSTTTDPALTDSAVTDSTIAESANAESTSAIPTSTDTDTATSDSAAAAAVTTL